MRSRAELLEELAECRRDSKEAVKARAVEVEEMYKRKDELVEQLDEEEQQQIWVYADERFDLARTIKSLRRQLRG